MGSCKTIFVVTALLILILFASCSRNASQPILPSGLEAPDTGYLSRGSMSIGHESPLGSFDVVVNPSKPEVILTPLRQSMEIGDSWDLEIDQYLQSSPCRDCLKIANIGFDEDGHITMDVGIKHPYDGSNNRFDLDVFDVRAILVVSGYQQFPQTLVDGSPVIGNFKFLENADGYTSHFDDGPDGDFSGNINPYVDFFTEDDPDWDGIGSEIPNHRMTIACGYDYQRLIMNVPPGENYSFRLVIGASYGQSAKKSIPAGDPGSRINPLYFVPEFNRKEVYSMNTEVEGLVFGTESGFSVALEAYDWQAGAHVGSVSYQNLADISAPSSLDTVSLEVPEIGYYSSDPTSQEGNGSTNEPLEIRFTVPVSTFSLYSYLAAVKDERHSDDLEYSTFQYGELDTFIKTGQNSEIAQITTNTHSMVLGRNSMAVFQNRVYIVWADVQNMEGVVFCARSSDGGQTFSAPTKVNDLEHVDSKQKPSVAVDDDGIVYVVWEDYGNLNPFSDAPDILMAKSNNDGYSFGPNTRVNDAETVADDFQTEPSIYACGSGTVYVSWLEKTSGEPTKFVKLARSTNGGSSFQETRVSSDQLRMGNTGMGANDSGTIWVTWRDYRNDNQDIFASKSTNGGQSFGPEIKVNTEDHPFFQSSPAISVDSEGTAYIAWMDIRDGGFNIYFASSKETGSFTDNIRINRINGVAFDPAIACTPEGGVFVTYKDTRDDVNGDIYVTASLDGGETFTVTHDVKINDDNIPSIQMSPQIAVGSDGKLHFAWGDGRDLCGKIFYARSVFP